MAGHCLGTLVQFSELNTPMVPRTFCSVAKWKGLRILRPLWWHIAPSQDTLMVAEHWHEDTFTSQSNMNCKPPTVRAIQRLHLFFGGAPLEQMLGEHLPTPTPCLSHLPPEKQRLELSWNFLSLCQKAMYRKPTSASWAKFIPVFITLKTTPKYL